MIEKIKNKYYYGNRCLGVSIMFVLNDGIKVKAFLTHIKVPSIHFFIKIQGYAVNDELLSKLKDEKIEYIVVPEDAKRDGFRIFYAPILQFLDAPLMEENAEPQRGISLSEMTLANRKISKDYIIDVLRG